MKRSVALLISILLGAVFLVSTGPAATAAPYCGITWGSRADARHTSSFNGSLTNVRGGAHTCFDRLIVDVSGDIRGFDVRYVCVVLHNDSGAPVRLRGSAALQVIAYVPDRNPAGQAVYHPADVSGLVPVTGHATFRQVAYAGSSGGETHLGLGVRAELPFRTFILRGPGAGSRLVVDVAHKW